MDNEHLPENCRECEFYKEHLEDCVRGKLKHFLTNKARLLNSGMTIVCADGIKVGIND